MRNDSLPRQSHVYSMLMTFRPFALLLMFALVWGRLCALEVPSKDSDRVPTDAEAVKLMEGYWMLAKKEPAQPFESVSLVLRENGRFTLEEIYKTDVGPLRITKQGKWWVKDGIAYGQFLQSSDPDIAPVGYMTEDKILRLDARIMELRTKEGDLERWEKNSG